MGIIIDVIMIAIIALSVFLGYRKGFISLAVQLCAFLIAIVITLIIYKPVANLIIDNTPLDENIQNAILEKANETVDSATNNVDMEIVENQAEDIKTEMLPEAARDLSINIINIAVMIILYLIIRIILRIITAIANLVAQLPILKQFNKIGGIIYGLIRGLLIIYVALLLIGFIGQINPQNSIHENINKSLITKAMYENNVLKIFLK